MGTFNKAENITIDRIQSATSRLETELGLSGFLEIEHIFDPGVDSETNTPPYAMTSPNWHYRSGLIRWYLQPVCLLTDDELEQVIIHEYVHILVHPITQLISSDDLTHREEYSVESIARAICHARGMKNIH